MDGCFFFAKKIFIFRWVPCSNQKHWFSTICSFVSGWPPSKPILIISISSIKKCYPSDDDGAMHLLPHERCNRSRPYTSVTTPYVEYCNDLKVEWMERFFNGVEKCLVASRFWRSDGMIRCDSEATCLVGGGDAKRDTMTISPRSCTLLDSDQNGRRVVCDLFGRNFS